MLGAFAGDHSEHLSAAEVYTRAAKSLPGLSRGTVYATLAEFSELGLLSAFRAPDPVRYETNTAPHAHFRCQLCARLFDLDSGLQYSAAITDRGFVVKRVDTQAEGVCADCTDYGTASKPAFAPSPRPAQSVTPWGLPGWRRSEPTVHSAQ